jgi:hypothetical protein
MLSNGENSPLENHHWREGHTKAYGDMNAGRNLL